LDHLGRLDDLDQRRRELRERLRPKPRRRSQRR
jgi:hypothetical protein